MLYFYKFYNFLDCEDKISELEKVKKIHENWLKESSKLQLEHAGDGEVEICEEVTEEEYTKQKGKN